MESQILQAVEIAFSAATTDASLKTQAVDFINQIKSSPDAWKTCLNLIQSPNDISPNAKFFSFQIINEQLPNLSNDDKSYLNQIILSHLKSIIDSNKLDDLFIRNAFAKTLSLIFVHSTLSVYSNLISDLLSLAKTPNGMFNEIGCDYYSRTLLMIHQEIGDQMIARDQVSIDRNALLKDAIRSNDMESMTQSWKSILMYFNSNNNTNDQKLINEIINNTIQCIGGYVSWIEINLILDPELMQILYVFLTSPNQNRKIITSNTFNEILHKKMTASKKLELISFLNLGGVLTQLNIANPNDLDFDVALAFSKLINQIGVEIIILLESSSDEELSNDQFRDLACSKIIEIFPLALLFINHDYDDISLEIFPFIGNFLLYLKKQITSNLNFSIINNDEIVTTLLKTILLKLKFADDQDGDDDDEIEQFNEVRSKLVLFIDSIVILNETLALDVIISCLNEFLFMNSENDWKLIESGLFVLNYYSDMLRNNVMNLPKTMINNSKPYFVFNEMLCRVINNSQNILISHPLIQLEFFELIMKHYTFFNNNNIQVENVNKDEILMKVLNIFVSNFGLFSDNEKVKYRSWYLFFRFIKMTKPKIDDYIIIELIKSIVPLLSLDSKIIQNKNKTSLEILDLNLIDETGSFENQLHLFESIGLLISIIQNNDEEILMLESILQPIFSNLENSINNLSTLNLDSLISVHHNIISIGTIIKGFENINTDVYNDKFANILNQISQVISITLENFINYNIIRISSNFCIVRLFLILSKFQQANEILENVLSKFISILMINFEKLQIDEIINFINFISQLFHSTGKNQSIYIMLTSLLSPFISKICTKIQSIDNDGSIEIDDFTKREKLDLQKSFISMLIAFSNEHLNSVWLYNDENKASLISIIELMLNYSNNYQVLDLSLIKLSFLQLNVLCHFIGTGKINDQSDINQDTNLNFDQFDDLLINNSLLLFMDLGLRVPSQNKSLLKDAQFRSHVLLEVVRLLKSIIHAGFNVPDANSIQKNDKPKFNEINVGKLSNLLVNQMGFSNDLNNTFIETLISKPDRQFIKYLTNIIENA